VVEVLVDVRLFPAGEQELLRLDPPALGGDVQAVSMVKPRSRDDTGELVGRICAHRDRHPEERDLDGVEVTRDHAEREQPAGVQPRTEAAQGVRDVSARQHEQREERRDGVEAAEVGAEVVQVPARERSFGSRAAASSSITADSSTPTTSTPASASWRGGHAAAAAVVEHPRAAVDSTR